MTMKDKCVGMRNEFREGEIMTKNDGFELDGTFAIVMRGSIKDANIINELIEEKTNLHVVYKKASTRELYVTDEKPMWIDENNKDIYYRDT